MAPYILSMKWQQQCASNAYDLLVPEACLDDGLVITSVPVCLQVVSCNIASRWSSSNQRDGPCVYQSHADGYPIIALYFQCTSNQGCAVITSNTWTAECSTVWSLVNMLQQHLHCLTKYGFVCAAHLVCVSTFGVNIRCEDPALRPTAT